jgi:hypothetical protein
MEPANTKPRFGQFTLKGLLGYVTLIAVSLATIRMGFAIEGEWSDLRLPFVLVGVFLLCGAISFAIAAILWPNEKWPIAVVGAFLLPTVLFLLMGFGIIK